MKKVYRITISLILAISFFIIPFKGLEVSSEGSRALVDHSPITINGNAALETTVSNEGWSGTGSEIDPYVIADYRIIANSPYGIYLKNIDLHVRISGCNISTSSQVGIFLEDCSNIEITGSVLFAHQTDGIRITGSDNCSVNNVTMDMEDMITINYNGIRVIDSFNNRFADNHLARMVNDGILIEGSSTSNVITRNVIEQNINNGILLRSDGNLVQENEAYAHDKAIKIEGDDNRVIDNYFRRNGYGVYITNGNGNEIKQNRLNRNFMGIKVITSLENTIVDNYIGKSASYGVDLYCNPGSGNVVHSNHFYYNNGTLGAFDPRRIQARDLSAGNTWYDSSINRGNFFYDWRGNDNNDDGIVDLSYPVDGNGDPGRYCFLNPLLPDAFIPPWKVSAHPQSNYIEIRWFAPFYGPGTDITHFQIYRSERGGGELFLENVLGDRTNYIDHDVLSGRAYFYYIIAVNDLAYSNQSMRVKSSPDTRRPSIEIDEPEDGINLNISSVTILYTGTDNIAVDRYEVTLDDGEPIDKGLWTNITFHELEEGEHIVNVTVYDLAEHYRTSFVSFNIDLTPPLISINNGDDGTIITNTMNPVVSWVAMDTGSGIAGYYLSLDGMPFSYVGIDNEYRFNDLLPGNHTMVIRADDVAGNSRNDSIEMFVDPDLPFLDIIEPEDLFINNTGSIHMKWYGRDQGIGIDRYLIRWGQKDWKDLGNSTEYLLTDLNEGTHTIYLRAFDLAGNNVTSSRSVTVDLTPPEMDITVPVQGKRYSSEFTIEWTAADLLTGIKEVRFRLDDLDWRTFGPEEPIVVGFPNNGEHTFILEAYDNAMNKVSMTRSFFFDVTRPMVDSVIPLPQTRDVPVDTSISIGFSEPVEISTIRLDMEEVNGTYEWEGNNLTFVPDGPLEYDRRYSLSITGTDIAGNLIVPFTWYFITEVDLSIREGLVRGRILDVYGQPVFGATIRFNSGERAVTDENGSFQATLKEGDGYLVISKDGYAEQKIDFTVTGQQITEMGDIPIREIIEEEEKEDDSGNGLILILMIASVLIVIIGALVGWQIKKTRDYRKMPLIEDEWVNVPVKGQPMPIKSEEPDVREIGAGDRRY